jgi:hypothetical protein
MLSYINDLILMEGLTILRKLANLVANTQVARKFCRQSNSSAKDCSHFWEHYHIFAGIFFMLSIKVSGIQQYSVGEHWIQYQCHSAGSTAKHLDYVLCRLCDDPMETEVNILRHQYNCGRLYLRVLRFLKVGFHFVFIFNESYFHHKSQR